MINKFDGIFTTEDEKLIQIFNVFCGISLENARLYRASIDLSLQLKSFFDISVSLSQPQTIRKLCEDILKNTRKVIGAVKASMYINDDNELGFSIYASDIEFEAKTKRSTSSDEPEDTLGVKRAIIAKLMHREKGEFDGDAQLEEENRNKLIQHVLTSKE